METLVNLEEDQIKLFDAVLDYDDQKLFDYIFKNISLNNKVHEVFIDKYLKNFSKQGNFWKYYLSDMQRKQINEAKF